MKHPNNLASIAKAEICKVTKDYPGGQAQGICE